MVPVQRPHFYTPDELMSTLHQLLTEVPANFAAVYLSSRGHGLHWVTDRPGTFAPMFIGEMRDLMPNASEEQILMMAGHKEALYYLTGLCKLWKHCPPEALVDYNGETVPDAKRMIFDPDRLAEHNEINLCSFDDMIDFLASVPRIHINDYNTDYSTMDGDFQYANVLYLARDNIARLDENAIDSDFE